MNLDRQAKTVNPPAGPCLMVFGPRASQPVEADPSHWQPRGSKPAAVPLTSSSDLPLILPPPRVSASS